MHLLQCTLVAFVPDKLTPSTIPEMTRTTRYRSVVFWKKRNMYVFTVKLSELEIWSLQISSFQRNSSS
jgi:hypothetical protein